jgi:hypothetical protein
MRNYALGIRATVTTVVRIGVAWNKIVVINSKV